MTTTRSWTGLAAAAALATALAASFIAVVAIAAPWRPTSAPASATAASWVR